MINVDLVSVKSDFKIRNITISYYLKMESFNKLKSGSIYNRDLLEYKQLFHRTFKNKSTNPKYLLNILNSLNIDCVSYLKYYFDFYSDNCDLKINKYNEHSFFVAGNNLRNFLCFSEARGNYSQAGEICFKVKESDYVN